MNNSKEIVRDLLYNKKYNDLSALKKHIDSLILENTQTLESLTEVLIDTNFIEEIKQAQEQEGSVTVYFTKSLRDIVCIIMVDDREHEIQIHYKGFRKLSVNYVQLPHTSLQDREYSCLEDVLVDFRKHLDNLSGYFRELEHIDRHCTVMDPVKPTFRDDYRRILIDDRTWLHVEVTPEGSAVNVHLVGQLEHWQDRLQAGLIKWDHDKDIVENIMTVFDITEFPVPANKASSSRISEAGSIVEAAVCSICLCTEIPDCPGVPQPLCQNTACGVNFHRSCLYQWLVACAGGRPPAFGVATGSCPTCLQPISCNQGDI